MAKVLFLQILCFLLLPNVVGTSQVAVVLFKDLSEKLETFTNEFNTHINSINLRLENIEGTIGMQEDTVNNKIDLVNSGLGGGQSENSDAIKTKYRFMKALILEKRYMRSLVRDNEEKFDKFKLGVKHIVSNFNVTFHELSETLVARTEQSKLVDDILNIQDRVSTLEYNHKTCEVPTDIDRRLSMYMYKSQEREDIGSGDVVDADSYVYINCTGVDEQRYEPAHRRFQCKFGQWKEADRNQNWNFGNNGEFPKCREAICEPSCENGGVCDKDGECLCQQMTKGKRCETLLCDESCTNNGGECVKPGVCGNCPKTRHGNNCEIESTCKIPTDIDRHVSIYRISQQYVSPGAVIDPDTYVFINCSDVDGQRYEPANRRFQCMLGQWKVADINPNWNFGNNGIFPKCREAICEPPCENGGVCDKDGECLCQQMTKGKRCETLRCDESCTNNGGECVKPGVCGNCPKTRHGDNCEFKRCKLEESSGYIYTDTSENYIKLPRWVKEGTNVTVKCKYRDYYMDYYNYDSVQEEETITCNNGRFPDVSLDCRTSSEQDGAIITYVVGIQVADTRHVGTDDTIYVRIDGYDENTEWFTMNRNFGRHNPVANAFRGMDVRPIQKVVVKKDSGPLLDDNLKIVYASIYIIGGDDYYVFTKQDKKFWLTSNTLTSLSISGHPERCVHTFGEAMNRSPKQFGRPVLNGSLRECKQSCVTTRSLACNIIYFWPFRNDRRGHGYCYHYTVSPDSDRFRDNSQWDTSSGRVSYKRTCRQS